MVICYIEVLSLGKVPSGGVCTCPHDLACSTHGTDGEDELVLSIERENGAMVGDTFNLDVVERTRHRTNLTDDVAARFEGIGTILAVFHHFNDGLQIAWAIVHPDFLVEFGLNDKFVGNHLVCLNPVGIEIKGQS